MKQLGVLDSAFINLEHKNVPQHIGSFGIYDQSTAPGGKVRFKSVINHFEHQIKKIPLFRTRLIQSPGRFARPYWLVDDSFDVEFHLRHIALPHPGDWRQLCILIARLHSRPIDMSRPLWESYVIEGLDNIEGLPDGCFVIYTKIHHSIVDGGGADNFMAAIHDLEPILHDDDEADEVFEAEAAPGTYEMVSTSTRSYFNNAWNLTKGGFQLSNDVVRSGIKLAKGDLKAPPTDAPTTRFNNPVGPHRVIEAGVFDFEDIKAIKNKTNTKVNDVALAIVSGAMRKFLDAHNEHPETSLVASVPMNMRTRRGDNGDANQVGAIFTSLNSTIDDPLERLLAIHHSSDEAKEFGENAPLKDALKLAGAMSPRVTKRLIDTYVDNQLTRHLPMKINTVVSNVAGPNFPLYCSGAKLIRYHGLGVLTPGVGLFHLIFTYCGKMTTTIMADRDMMPDPEFYSRCIAESFDELQAAVEKATPKEIETLIDKHSTAEERVERVLAKAEKVIATAEKNDADAAEAIAEDAPKPKRKRAARKASSSSKAVVTEAAVEAPKVEDKPAEAPAKSAPVRKRAASSKKAPVKKKAAAKKAPAKVAAKKAVAKAPAKKAPVSKPAEAEAEAQANKETAAPVAAQAASPKSDNAAE
ncbi:Putative diacyglycerol O-acyltransferase [BD1-7 clade bacterium]|uniref:diacylglycerol O-acyltransferase n=1 Tax=BD1-7 clade bacterium TaxID=2029982 RepID=A0A5S9NZ92_9GAMM|nr:Putative diacyglycerol O-acyltransferase [BD1-7 clade bacterium]CAA0096035.1 Putative diacyglycerol O-acyltransferase [BD1-7 clade bacterium]